MNTDKFSICKSILIIGTSTVFDNCLTNITVNCLAIETIAVI